MENNIVAFETDEEINKVEEVFDSIFATRNLENIPIFQDWIKEIVILDTSDFSSRLNKKQYQALIVAAKKIKENSIYFLSIDSSSPSFIINNEIKVKEGIKIQETHNYTILFDHEINFIKTQPLLSSFIRNEEWFPIFWQFNIDLDIKIRFVFETIFRELDRAIFSPSGKWGVIIVNEFAILGGTEEFINEFKKKYPDYKKDRKKFFDTCEETDWSKALEKYVYGE